MGNEAASKQVYVPNMEFRRSLDVACSVSFDQMMFWDTPRRCRDRHTGNAAVGLLDGVDVEARNNPVEVVVKIQYAKCKQVVYHLCLKFVKYSSDLLLTSTHACFPPEVSYHASFNTASSWTRQAPFLLHGASNFVSR